MGVGKIIIIDYDSIELSNLSRQLIYKESDVGKLKVEVAKEVLSNINPAVQIEIHNMKIDSASCIDPFIKEADLVINSIDHPPIKSARWVNFSCMKNRKTLIQGGLLSRSIFVDIFSSTQGCYDCYLINSIKINPSFISELSYAYENLDVNVNMSYAPNVTLLASVISNNVSNYFLNLDSLIATRSSTEIDVHTLEKKFINQHIKLSYCPTCSNCNTLDEPVCINDLIKISEEYIERDNK